MRKYKEVLLKAQQEHINIFDLVIANEVNDYLLYQDSAVNQKDFDRFFEDVCDLVKDIWLKLDNHISLSSVVNGVIKEYANYQSKKTNKSELIDIICQCYA
jgi:hypothetical protein